MRIGFIGTGAMARAIARGAVNGGLVGSDLLFTDINTEASASLASELGATAIDSNIDLATQADLIVLAVKPHIQSLVIAEIADTVRSRPQAVVVSIAAGRTLSTIIDDFGFGVRLVRVMPNVNAQIGQSMSSVCSANASDEDVAAVVKLMETVGRALVVPESQFPAFQALAACSPAWVFQMIEDLARAGVKHGLTKTTATQIAAQAFAGSAALVLDRQSCEGTVPSQLVDQVCSPGGTTIAGLLAAQEHGLSSALVHAVDAAISRDAELS
ncbi:pyrroline-5-carboxylate reductase [Schaalia vaccimaxillae]|uniref:pyrroline-5-carboxylate reductase n=1 Tax=Schaalia vaccimaxillae TaxID=183916 RepID=UPI0003B64AF5|nr:pyrroline-5-carboxylate reductase [Schaalia vaccimaxillae]